MRINVINANKARRQDLTGLKFNRLTFIKFSEEHNKWLCTCECGGNVYVIGAQVKNGNTKSCGCLQKQKARKSLLKRHSTIRRDKGLPEDIPLSSESILERMKMIPIRKEVMIRDEYCCAWCSQLGGKLSVHHIIPWSESETTRFEKSNLVTLCYNCHKKVHQSNWCGELDHCMSILLQGYVNEVESICVRRELT